MAVTFTCITHDEVMLEPHGGTWASRRQSGFGNVPFWSLGLSKWDLLVYSTWLIVDYHHCQLFLLCVVPVCAFLFCFLNVNVNLTTTSIITKLNHSFHVASFFSFGLSYYLCQCMPKLYNLQLFELMVKIFSIVWCSTLKIAAQCILGSKFHWPPWWLLPSKYTQDWV